MTLNLKENNGWCKSHPKMAIFLFVVFVIAVVYLVLYLKLRPLREYSGMSEQPVPLGTSTGNH